MIRIGSAGGKHCAPLQARYIGGAANPVAPMGGAVPAPAGDGADAGGEARDRTNVAGPATAVLLREICNIISSTAVDPPCAAAIARRARLPGPPTTEMQD